MCVSLLARAAQPCAMHQHERGGAAQVMAGHEAGDTCHGEADLGCASGGTCPTSGTAAPLAAQPALLATALGRDATFTLDPTPHSFSAAPGTPPPQV
jgi:hypothetical protein